MCQFVTSPRSENRKKESSGWTLHKEGRTLNRICGGYIRLGEKPKYNNFRTWDKFSRRELRMTAIHTCIGWQKDQLLELAQRFYFGED